MEYRVKHMESGIEKWLHHSEINDMDFDRAGRIVVFDTNMEAYWLIDQE
ncbi:hypothetical protein [Paenibacillus aestuarii]|uniref:Uncharacterized protein n=1 Tax=Paenibacillus aestuarii TaxID=516965 RepID=A0ABW0K4V6_9BACL|nr:hypothetical protein [Paenibacillus aestuarii]